LNTNYEADIIVTRKEIIKTKLGDIRRDNKDFWKSIYNDYLTSKNSLNIAKSLKIDVRMLFNILKEHGFKKLTSSDARKGKIVKDYIESISGIKYDLNDKEFWDSIYNKYINDNYSENRLSESISISRKQLRRAFRYHKYPTKTDQQIKDTIIESNNVYFNSDRPALNINVKRKISNSHLKSVLIGMLDKIENLGYELMEDYRGTRVFNTGGPNSTTWNNYRFKHLECGAIFTDNLMRTPRCPKCYNNSSQAEERIKLFIESLGYKTERKILSDRKHIDIFIPELNVGFEYNGTIWHSSKYKISSIYHKNKTETSLKEGIKLYHIWEYEDEDIVKSKIRHILNKSKNRIFARNTEIKFISSKEVELFLNNNHSFKHCSGLFNFGLYYKNELVSVMSFRRKGHNNIELIRFCNKLDFSVIGSFSKLLKHSIKHIKENYPKIEKITTFGYRDVCPLYEDSVYYKNGFKFISYINPTLTYYKHSNKTIYNRQRFMKSKLINIFPDVYSEDLTEAEILKKVGIYAIYNSGTLKFELNIDKEGT
jgi:hypothetical protein